MDKIPEGSILQAKIVKTKLVDNYFLPQFDVYFKDTDIHIISAKKQIGNIGSNYPLSINSEGFGKIKNNYIGKVRTAGD